MSGGAMSARVYFSDGGGGKGLRRWLKPGFRHCFAAIEDDRGGWIGLDACGNAIRLDYAAGPGIAGPMLPDTQIAVEVDFDPLAEPPPRSGLRPLTCVEVVKLALGIRARWVFTPWQLYRLLTTKEPMK